MGKTNKTNIDKKTIQKIGSLPLGFDSNSVVFISEGKIFIANTLKKKY